MNDYQKVQAEANFRRIGPLVASISRHLGQPDSEDLDLPEMLFDRLVHGGFSPGKFVGIFPGENEVREWIAASGVVIEVTDGQVSLIPLDSPLLAAFENATPVDWDLEPLL